MTGNQRVKNKRQTGIKKLNTVFQWKTFVNVFGGGEEFGFPCVANFALYTSNLSSIIVIILTISYFFSY